MTRQQSDLHNAVEIVPPVSKAPGPYAATYRFDWLSASGTACLIVSIVSAFLLGMSPGKLVSVFFRTVRQLALAGDIASVMGLAYLMEFYSSATGTFRAQIRRYFQRVVIIGKSPATRPLTFLFRK